jgi:type I restriction-modification system DNA methylase subunit
VREDSTARPVDDRAQIDPATGHRDVRDVGGALFRKAAEGNIRTALLKEDLIEAVIGLAPNLFYGTQLAGCVGVERSRGRAANRRLTTSFFVESAHLRLGIR